MSLLLSFAVCFVSAFIPLVNAEAYVAAVAAATQGVSMWALAVVAAAGQMAGKVVWYEAGRRSTRWRWVQNWLSRPKRERQYLTWRRRVAGRPLAAGAVVLCSAFVGIPPLAIVSVLAGQLQLSRLVFVAAGMAGRFGRFALVIAGVSLLPWF